MPITAEIFGHDFTGTHDIQQFRDRFFNKELSIPQLNQIHDFIAAKNVTINSPHHGKEILIPACHLVKSTSSVKQNEAPFMLLTQLHGNEFAGLAAALLVIGLAEAGLLNRDVYVVIGNNYAARQFFAAWQKNPKAPQETRDDFRCGVDADGKLMPDLNRIPANFREVDPSTSPHAKRAQELDILSHYVSGVLDIHTARGNLTCITDHMNDADLLYSPIRMLLTNLSEAIGSNTGTKTFKGVFSDRKNIKSMTGIEAGRHEDPKAPEVAAEFTLALLYNLGITSVEPFNKDKENGEFDILEVQEKLSFKDLNSRGKPSPSDIFYTVKKLAGEKIPGKKFLAHNKDDTLSVESEYSETAEYVIHQFEEAEEIQAGQVVAAGVPSGVELLSPHTFQGIFFAKSKESYRDPAAGVLPISSNDFSTKFCYPCKKKKVTFKL